MVCNRQANEVYSVSVRAIGKNLSPFWASCHSLLASLWCREECPSLLPASPLDKVSGKPDSGLHFILAVTQAMRRGKGWSLVLSVLPIVTNISSAATTYWALSPVLFPVTSFIFPATLWEWTVPQTSQILEGTNVFVNATEILKWILSIT